MEFFGLTMYGLPDPIKYAMREDYKEPIKEITIYDEIAKGSKKSFADLVAEVDVYLGRPDGYSYRSVDRLQRMRRKGAFSLDGPNDKYRYAVTHAQNCSFWKYDPVIQESDWYKQRVFRPKKGTEISRFLEIAKRTDKFFQL